MPELPEQMNPRWRAVLLRDLIVDTLYDLGVRGARRPNVSVRRDGAEIDGLPVYLRVHRQQGMDLAGSQDAAARAAAQQGRSLWATIHHRKGRDLLESFVTMPLSGFAALLSALQADGLVHGDLGLGSTPDDAAS